MKISNFISEFLKKKLRSLSLKLNHLVVAIEETHNLSKVSVNDVMGSLEAPEKKIERFPNSPVE